MASARRTAIFALSIALFVVLWQILASVVDDRVLPGPGAVMRVLWLDILSGELPYHLGVTLARVAVSFALAMIIGSSIGLAMGRSGRIDRFFDAWLILFLNIPALVTIILCYVWFGLNEAAAVSAVAINKIPNVAVTMREGARALDPAYAKLARVYRLDRWRVLRHVVLPQLAPFFAASARSGMALVWKIVLVVELLGRGNGVGFQLNLFFQLFDVPSILAYTVAFVAIVQVIELGLFGPWERYANRWRA
ncbi:MAG: ABC transporter permease [Kiloniellaceae bacterium]